MQGNDSIHNDSFSLMEGRVSPEVYQYVRRECGLSPKSTDAATRGLAASLYMVHVRKDDEVVGMGRLIGDGGCFCQVVDICVLPGCQGLGLGKRIMHRLMEYVDEELPTTCYVSLMADGEAYKLYVKYGFEPVWPDSRGMFYRVK